MVGDGTKEAECLLHEGGDEHNEMEDDERLKQRNNAIEKLALTLEARMLKQNDVCMCRIASTESLGMNSNQLSGMNSRRVATTGPRTYLSQYCNMGLDYFGDVSFMEEKPQIYTNQFELTNSFSVGDNNIYQYLSSDKGSNSFDCP
ncbi:hypothetical protein Bca52824_017190 [Brassica carinata]|uniref:Uncharacterized protein n=1 Tax=Brassica carinata TaxID=52824 RepID=A0A8X7VN37_BRACI|nr:hypothetical protein Bca52824_017190 [Brassica carinata]